jgi:hypothetical protein
MATLIALYDACVLYPFTLRDILLHLACTPLFQAKWTDRIHAEWVSHLVKRGMKQQNLDRQWN